MTEARRGLVYGVVAYGLWGLAPVFWKQLPGIWWGELIAHRIVWGLGTFLAIVALAGAMPAVRAAATDRRTLAVMSLSALLLLINWSTFIAAVAAGHIVEASLGYFINPLLSVGLGMVVLDERLRRLQWIAIGFAVAGVAILTWRAGRVPWISLVIASTFAGYGLVRKRARVDSLAGSTLETALVAPIAAIYLGVMLLRGGGELGHATATTHALLVSTGLITAVPLLLFTSAARRLPLSTVGFLQYLAPTGQLLLAVTVYGETFAHDQLAAFGLIWIGLVAFSIDLARQRVSRTGR